MPRTNRFYCEYMHIIARGINKQMIFGDDEDKTFFLSMVKHFKKEEFIKIVVFCLMDNHIHLLVHDPDHRISVFMKRLCVTYSIYFNQKYERCGHLFQNRFKSQPVMDDKYLKTVFGYILMNPEKAGLCKYYEYTWSTFCEAGKKDTVTDFDEISTLFGSVPFLGIKADNPEYTSCIDIDVPVHDDSWALEIIKNEIGEDEIKTIKIWDKELKIRLVETLKNKGLSERQISRLTGISRKEVTRLKD